MRCTLIHAALPILFFCAAHLSKPIFISKAVYKPLFFTSALPAYFAYQRFILPMLHAFTLAFREMMTLFLFLCSDKRITKGFSGVLLRTHCPCGCIPVGRQIYLINSSSENPF